MGLIHPRADKQHTKLPPTPPPPPQTRSLATQPPSQKLAELLICESQLILIFPLLIFSDLLRACPAVCSGIFPPPSTWTISSAPVSLA